MTVYTVFEDSGVPLDLRLTDADSMLARLADFYCADERESSPLNAEIHYTNSDDGIWLAVRRSDDPAIAAEFIGLGFWPTVKDVLRVATQDLQP